MVNGRTGENESAIDWAGISEDTARQIAHDGEMYLAAQVQIALASDQRAMTAATIFTGFATAVLAAALAHWSGNPNSALFVPGIVAAALLVGAAACCFWAARPVDFYTPGAQPADWWPVRKESLAELLGGASENCQESISQNVLTITQNARWMGLGSVLAVLAPVASWATWYFS